MFYAICGLSVLLFSCREEEGGLSADPAQRIYLRAAVENTILMSRVPFDSSVPDEDHPLEVAVWASTTSHEFKHVDGKNGSDGTVALHTTAKFTAGSEQLLNDAVYPKDANTTVYFVGLHPEKEYGSAWTTNDAGTIATRTFNGSEDVMFAPQEEGKYGGNMSGDAWPTFRFKHLLTCLRVRVKAEKELVSEAWGELRSLKVKSSAGNTVTIDLSKEYSPIYNPDDPDKNCVTFSSGDGVTLDFYATGGNEAFSNKSYSLPYKENFEEVAYVLCAPVIASAENGDGDKTNEYTLIVETRNRTVEVPIDLMAGEGTENYFNGSTMNYQFVLNLNFKMGNSIIVTVSAADWKLGGISSEVVSPDKEPDKTPEVV